MANSYYDHGSVPATGSTGSSASMRAEFDAVEAGFDKLPTLSGYANKAVIVNSGGTALTTTSGSMSLAGDLTLAGALTTSGAYGLTFTLTALTSVTLPTSGTLSTLAGTETLTNKTLNLTSNTLTGTIAQFNTACSDADFATLAGTETLTNKTLNLTSNTLTGTIAQFNAACSDADFSTSSGVETLTNKTLNLTSNTLTGTIAQFNAACSDADFATLAGAETLTNKTLTSVVLNTGVSGTAIAAQSDVDAGSSTSLLMTPGRNRLALGTYTAASGTSIDITGIPSGVRRITILIDGLSLNATAQLRIQLGDSGGVETSGYSGWLTTVTNTEVAISASSGIDFQAISSAVIYRGRVVLELMDSATNLWLATANMCIASTDVQVGSVSKATSAVLDRIRLTTVAGTASFDAGNVNIIYER